MKILWTGTDALMINNISQRTTSKKPFWIIVRIIVWFLDKTLLEAHLVNSVAIKADLELFGMTKPIEIMLTPLKYNKPFKKIKHDGFNVLYYKRPRADMGFRDWLYGIDLIDKLKREMDGQVTFIEANGKLDMELIFPIVDFCIRPNRHDGNSRLMRECMIQKIPFYWSQTNPDYKQMKYELNKEISKVEGIS